MVAALWGQDLPGLAPQERTWGRSVYILQTRGFTSPLRGAIGVAQEGAWEPGVARAILSPGGELVERKRQNREAEQRKPESES